MALAVLAFYGCEGHKNSALDMASQMHRVKNSPEKNKAVKHPLTYLFSSVQGLN
jgi:hypothetical protein